MKLWRFVLLVGLVGLFPGCGQQEGEPAPAGKRLTDKETQADKDAGRGSAMDARKSQPDPKPAARLDPPQIALTAADPPETTPPSPAKAVDPVPTTLPPVVPPETSPPAIVPKGVAGDTRGNRPATSGEGEVSAKSSGGAVENLTSADSGTTVSTGVGNLVIIELESNPSTGFAWEPDSGMKDSVLVLKSKEFETLSQRNPEIPPALGQGGFTTFTYQVAETGKATISLSYRRPGEKDTVSAKTFEVDIEAARTTSPVVTGKIVFNEEPDLAKISRIVVSIRNTALADGPAPLIGTAELKPPFKLPITFAVPYDPAKVQPNPMFYSVSVRVNTIVDGSEKLYYINDTHHPVFRNANDTKCDVAVKKLR